MSDDMTPYQKKLAEEGTEKVRRQEADKQRERYWSDPAKARQRVQDRKAAGLAGNRVKKLRTPPWLTAEEREEVKRFCAACPPGMSVDHIIPTVHSLLAGLHVIGNLQYLPVADNISKGNKFDCSMQEAKRLVREGLAVWAADVLPDGSIPWEKYGAQRSRRGV